MKKILIVDNYDSFTYNLFHAVNATGSHRVDVIRNDRIEPEQALAYDKIIISPGPGIPEEAGCLLPLVELCAPTKSILGVCLGHQAIGVCFGAKLENIPFVFHGVQTAINITASHNIFDGLGSSFDAGRYHSWIVSSENFPHDQLEITATDAHNRIMAMKHRQYDVHGVQFHPESILTPRGIDIIRNFVTTEQQ